MVWKIQVNLPFKLFQGQVIWKASPNNHHGARSTAYARVDELAQLDHGLSVTMTGKYVSEIIWIE